MGTSSDAHVLISWHMIDATNQKRTDALNSGVPKKRKVQMSDVLPPTNSNCVKYSVNWQQKELLELIYE